MLVDKEALVVSLAGEITWQNSPHLRERLLLLIQQGHRSLIINMDSVTYVDSSGLAMIISVSRRLRALDGHLLLLNVSEAIVRALRQARLSDFIPAVGRGALQNHKIADAPADEAPLLVRTLGLSCGCSSMTETRQKVGELFSSLRLPRETTYDLVLALGEALGNAFDHGGGAQGDDCSVTVTVSVYRDRIVMAVTDCGCSYEEGDALPEPTEARGRGIRLMLMLADSIQIQPKQSGQGTCVRLVKMIDPQQTASLGLETA